MNLFFIWSHLPSYALACLKNLSTKSDINVFIASYGNPPGYVDKDLLHNVKIYDPNKSNHYLNEQLYHDVTAFKTDILFVTGWSNWPLLLLSHEVRKIGIKTVSMIDTPFKNSLSQKVKAKVGGLILKKAFDIAWVASMESKRLLLFAGFSDKNCWLDLYCCDSTKYRPFDSVRDDNTFLFVGRLEEVKNLKLLLKGFDKFNQLSNNKYKLKIIGDGKLKEKVIDSANTEYLGKMDSDSISKEMNRCKFFILPSKFEPWGVVVHEAASCGLPMVLSNNVGAASRFLINEKNGFLFDPYSIDSLSHSLLRIANDSDYDQMSRLSRDLGKGVDIEFWCSSLIKNLQILQIQK